MKLVITAILLVGSFALSGCGGDDSAEPGAAAKPPSTTATTTSATLTGDELFVQELRLGGIYPQPSQVPLLTPAARANCDALGTTTLPDNQKFDKMVELSMLLGRGKNVFDNTVTAEAFMKASIRAYCPQYEDLITS